MIGEKASCKDEKSEKACQKLKEKNKGKGCKKKSTKKKCKMTCGLCDDSNFFFDLIILFFKNYLKKFNYEPKFFVKFGFYIHINF